MWDPWQIYHICKSQDNLMSAVTTEAEDHVSILQVFVFFCYQTNILKTLLTSKYKKQFLGGDMQIFNMVDYFYCVSTI